MKESKLIIKIKRPVAEVFEFTINPANTPRWIDAIVSETTDTEEISIDTRYINVNNEGEKNSYQVSKFEKDRIFELQSLSSKYGVRYTYIPLSQDETELEYFEWDENLFNPFTIDVLQKLKTMMEKTV